ncbi:MAG: hypothetical protein Q8N63_03280 [Nanoarchaeota archaeon]|nr:hypothetical protein [Nanoarchaeota archaeon]
MATENLITLLEMITELSSKDLIAIITTIIFAVIIIKTIIYKEINKINNELKRLDEKLKIYERLSIIEAKLNFKNGSKK